MALYRSRCQIRLTEFSWLVTGSRLLRPSQKHFFNPSSVIILAFGLGLGAAPFHTGPAGRPEWQEHEFRPPILAKCYVGETCFVVRLS